MSTILTIRFMNSPFSDLFTRVLLCCQTPLSQHAFGLFFSGYQLVYAQEGMDKLISGAPPGQGLLKDIHTVLSIS